MYKLRDYISLIWNEYRVRDVLWKVLHRYHPRYRYHVVNTNLPAGYYDPTERIKHSSFELFCEWWEGCRSYVVFSDAEIVMYSDVYDWWRKGRVVVQREVDYLWETTPSSVFTVGKAAEDGLLPFVVSINTSPETKELWDQKTERATELEEYILTNDKKYLKIIVENINSLWYP